MRPPLLPSSTRLELTWSLLPYRPRRSESTLSLRCDARRLAVPHQDVRCRREDQKLTRRVSSSHPTLSEMDDLTPFASTLSTQLDSDHAYGNAEERLREVEKEMGWRSKFVRLPLVARLNSSRLKTDSPLLSLVPAPVNVHPSCKVMLAFYDRLLGHDLNLLQYSVVSSLPSSNNDRRVSTGSGFETSSPGSEQVVAFS